MSEGKSGESANTRDGDSAAAFSRKLGLKIHEKWLRFSFDEIQLFNEYSIRLPQFFCGGSSESMGVRRPHPPFFLKSRKPSRLLMAVCYEIKA